MWSGGMLALILVLASGVARAAPDAAAWAFDLLARVEQWQSAGPLEFLSEATKDQPISIATQARIQKSYGRLPMHFEPNLGQTADEVKYVARGPGYTLFLTADEAVLALRPGRPASDRADPRHPRRPFDPAMMTPNDASAVPGAVIRTRLEGATRNPAPQPEGMEKLPGISNYFLGNDPAQWRTHVPHYQRVRYPNVYPGIDLVYYGNPQRLEHDFIVAPGADPAVIQLAISGAEQATVNAEGDLVLTVPGGEIIQQAPKIYQIIDGQPQAVAGRYVLREVAPGAPPTVNVAAAEPAPPPLWVGFEVAQYDSKRPLVIDPVLVYSSYLGGSDGEGGYAITVDSAGHAYVTGSTRSIDFPTVNAPYPYLSGSRDAFIFKLNADGSAAVYSTYLGGSDEDWGEGITVDGAGNAYVTGATRSIDFPTVNAPYPHFQGGYSDAFVFKFNADGSAAVYSTYLGGSDEDWGEGIAVDSAGHAYVTGSTYSTDFPTVNAPYPYLSGSRDAFIFKLNADGSAAVYSTYLGGSDSDWGAGIAVDGAGNAYVTGDTYSDFPTVNAPYPHFQGGYSDAFIFKLAANGSAAVYSTYLGGSDEDWGYAITVDGAGNAYVTGSTYSTDFPTVNAPYPYLSGSRDAFVFKLNADGSAAVYSTYLGGSDSDWGYAIAVDGAGNAYVTGATRSIDFPTVNAPYPHFQGGYSDAFVFKFNADGSAAVYSTYLGGSDEDWGEGIAVDSAGHAYVTGSTYSTDFPTVNALYSYFEGLDAFIAKIADTTQATLLAGLTSAGRIYYTLDRATWVNIPGQLSQLQVGDLNGDGQADLVGLTSAGKIYYTLNRSTWVNIPGTLAQLVVGDLDGNGYADLAGLTSAGNIYYITNPAFLYFSPVVWQKIPGQLSQLQVGDFDGDGQADLAGLTDAGRIYYTLNLNTWVNIPGYLSRLVTGDFNDDGRDDLAGLTSTGRIYYTLNRSTWLNIPGYLSRLVAGDLDGDGQADLAGLAGDGTVWYTTSFSTWTRIPGQLSRLVAGDFNNDGRDDLAGLTDAGRIYYTLNRNTWVNIPGQLYRLADDPD